MSSFKENTPQRVEQSFDSRLTDYVNRCQQLGRDGMGHQGKEFTTSTYLVDTDMHPEVFRLGCAVKHHPAVTAEKWGAWMRDCEFTVGQEVVFYMRSGFFCDHAERQFGDALQEHYQRRVRFKPSAEIRVNVNKRIA